MRMGRSGGKAAWRKKLRSLLLPYSLDVIAGTAAAISLAIVSRPLSEPMFEAYFLMMDKMRDLFCRYSLPQGAPESKIASPCMRKREFSSRKAALVSMSGSWLPPMMMSCLFS